MTVTRRVECGGCGRPVPVGAGFPVVAAGRVELRCAPGCLPDAEVAPPPVVAVRPSRGRLYALAGALAGVTLVLLGVRAPAETVAAPAPTAMPVASALAAWARPALGLLEAWGHGDEGHLEDDLAVDPDVAFGEVPADRAGEEEDAEGRRDADAAAALVASLDGEWVHPLPGPERVMPGARSRRFGAPREREAPGCGEGHCGIDLGHERGIPVLAVRDGVVARVVRHSEKRAGRYVKIVHEAGVHSYYMHLDEIDPELAPGVPVRAGEPIGTVGRTGILRSAPHLHFAIAVLGPRGRRYVDPEPLLADALLADPRELPGAADPVARR
jgi:murein DD-endopeptidase MepM/ murein hydrolase activator NlpD